ncbi:class I SAM-dependent methyltransferase [Bradyrhizobium sp. SSUT18]|uniref:class I SAM-dependent methyltransferase n=1 Tax=Bradyrhizobium sp. SSUT18 TaxID=3040602 RepID=UPI00244D61AD|nr:class I SAM-dependent methyltransferase [Bradyrhizobium sp. SSUT18]MDH2399636.1 class I SAM-dependent methyltransferase [Bradyrhizobium sp. SSUT18]
MFSQARGLVGPLFQAAFPSIAKRRAELAYWRDRYSVERGVLVNTHYEPLYTSAFELDRSAYSGKRVLDIGCGPRGSLEWADVAAQRVGLDPLVPDYRKLGIGRHKMEYCAAPSHKIPFPDGHFDFVTCLNALDHVDDFEGTVGEIKRVTKPGGFFLLSVEIDHPPTPAEPITITRNLLRTFAPEFEVVHEELFGTPEDHNLHAAILSKLPYVPNQPGIYVGKMRRAG